MIETDMSDWDRLPSGEIETLPMAGWATAATRSVVLLRVEILTEEGQIGTAQLTIPPEEAFELGRSLQWWAERSQASAQSGNA